MVGQTCTSLTFWRSASVMGTCLARKEPAKCLQDTAQIMVNPIYRQDLVGCHRQTAAQTRASNPLLALCPTLPLLTSPSTDSLPQPSRLTLAHVHPPLLIHPYTPVHIHPLTRHTLLSCRLYHRIPYRSWTVRPVTTRPQGSSHKYSEVGSCEVEWS